MMLLLKTVVFLAACCAAGTPSAVAGANDYKPVPCNSAKPYRGPALHPSPDTKVFTETAGALQGSFDLNTVARLNKAVEIALERTKSPAITAAIGVPGKGFWSTTRTNGADREVPDLKFYWASAGKAFTAVAVMLLVEEGRLKTNDPLSKWFPDFPNAKVITIDHLLMHTSGIYSFQNDAALRAMPGYKPPETLIAVAKKHGNAFCPGEYWSYCNTGYVLLARIIEEVEKRPFHEVLTRRVINRLGLAHTQALAPKANLEGVAAACPSKLEEVEKDFHFSTPFGAGCIVATADDMVRFWQALLTGQLLKPETVHSQFARLYPMFGNGTFYGRGVMLYDVPTKEGGNSTWLGHSGGCPGIKAVVAYVVDAKAFVAVALSNDGSAEATANLLLKVLKETQ
jgi:D-alanyl-D-alanine carboxypeptidase